ncbi:hypothetical protein [Sediminibacillus halophilus]|uniref:DUF4376 domain-containing protein n=1 Tax=Sediminibacillus halophilus TaxID=482461 RepID=A0A1G9QUI8_9BACI|nr:hypothetical protein [Sediminibacillus halophilus]SDM14530.1 hypothetical protein SAMN05216244_1666 [Sediminibacillus halophilus]
MKIYLFVDGDRVTGYGDRPSYTPHEIEIEVAENHEVLRNSRIFRYVDGELIRDDEHQLLEVKNRKIHELSAMCNKAILGYFNVDLDIGTYSFSFDKEAQDNFTNTMALMNNDVTEEVRWTAHKDGEVHRVTLDKNTFMTVAKAGFNHKCHQISRFRDELQPLVEQANTIEDIKAVQW